MRYVWTELYLSLPSCRYGGHGVSCLLLLGEHRESAVGSRIFDDNQLFHKDPDRLLIVLDALATICFSKEQEDVFFGHGHILSCFLRVAGREWCETVCVYQWDGTCHCHRPSPQIRNKLKQLESEYQAGETRSSSPLPDTWVGAFDTSIDSLNPNSTPSRSASELAADHLRIYSYKKVQQTLSKIRA